MGRPPLAVGTHGKIRFDKTSTGYRARANYRGYDGKVREMERSGKSRAKAERELKLAVTRELQVPGGGDIGPNSRFREVADQWLAWQERRVTSEERSPGTIDNYRSMLKNHVLPAFGELRLYEVSVPRLDKFFPALRAKSSAAHARTARAVVSGVLRYADLVEAYRHTIDTGDAVEADELREEIRSVDEELRQLGMRGRLPSVDLPTKKTAKRSTRRRQDAPNLPRRRVAKTTVGREYAGKFRPSMFVTLTCDSYGRVRDDGTPVDPATYDYRRAARDAVHFSALVDRWWQNLRRVVGWDAQYFATVEPQKRAAPHLHTAIRGSIAHDTIRQVTAATYHQVWWPHHDQIVYADRLPVWDANTQSFVDPETRQPLTSWDDAVEAVEDPAHVVTFGRQVHSKGILGGSEEAGRHIGYLTKYLTKSTGEVVESSSARQRDHHDRLHAELSITPCSPRCAVWLLYGIVPKGVGSRTTPGHCKGRAHRRSTLGLPGRRVLVSRKWSGKTLADHKADRKTFVRQALAAVGIEKPEPDPARLLWRKVESNDPHVPPRAHLIMRAIAERITWKAEYDRAMLTAAGPPGTEETSATQQAA